MNDYTTPGNYYCNSSNSAATFKNVPDNILAFTLKVEYSAGISNVCQTFRYYESGITAYRVFRAGAWSPYVYFKGNSTF